MTQFHRGTTWLTTSAAWPLAVLVAIASLGLASCSGSKRTEGRAASSPPKAQCWDGSDASVSCPPIEGFDGLKWLIPARKSGPSPDCKKLSPTDFSPPLTSEESLECTWPDQPGVILQVERFPDLRTAKSGCYSTQEWNINGVPYGVTGFTASELSGPGERWWCYQDSPIVLELINAPADGGLSSELQFRTPEQVQSGRQ